MQDGAGRVTNANSWRKQGSRSRPSLAARGHIPALQPVDAELDGLARVNNWRNGGYIAEDWLVIVAAAVGATATGGWPTYLIAMILIGSRMRALMNLVHQASHRQLFLSSRLNDWVGWLLVAWPLGVSVASYRSAHDTHHNLLWDEADDPKVERYKRYGLIKPAAQLYKFVATHLVLPALLRHSARNILAAIGSPGERRGRALFWGLILSAAIVTGTVQPLIMFWVVPFVTTFQIMRYWAEMAEHAGLESSSPWTATRNWTASLPVRWLLAPHSDHWHLAHHVCARIPHYRLAAAHRVLMHVPDYADRGHHCDGFLWPRRPDAPSVVGDMMHPEHLKRYKLVSRTSARSSQRRP